MPTSLPFAEPSSVTAIVEWPFLSLSAITSLRVASGVMFESLMTKPALKFFALATMAASSSMLCEPKMNDTPPSFASATASLSPETDCMMAETIGMLSDIAGSSPFLYFTRGVLSDTFAGMHSLDE